MGHSWFFYPFYQEQGHRHSSKIALALTVQAGELVAAPCPVRWVPESSLLRWFTQEEGKVGGSIQLAVGDTSSTGDLCQQDLSSCR